MAAGTCSHHDEVSLRHALAPRINCRFWLRHTRCARFTSLRDMSLRRNRHVARCTRSRTIVLRPIVRLMRGLRA
jgi:hypothetical protein